VKQDFSSWLRANFIANPMLVEINRFKKRFLSFHGPSNSVNGALGVILVLFALFCAFCILNRGDLPPIPLFFTGLTAQLFLIPIMLHGTIAGERERRSWEMLMVAPITKSQIVCGKFSAAAVAFSLLAIILSIPIFVTAAFYEKTSFIRLVGAFLVMVLQGLNLISYTILISARVKRPLVALAVTIGTVFVYYIFLPLLSGLFMFSTTTYILGGLSPFSMLTLLARDPGTSYASYSSEDMGAAYTSFQFVTHFVVAIVTTVVFLIWATKTLHFADNEVKFIKNSKKNA
jgi:ABC-type transport system involved in multi-copper enzyme maturation permease subunit